MVGAVTRRSCFAVVGVSNVLVVFVLLCDGRCLSSGSGVFEHFLGVTHLWRSCNEAQSSHSLALQDTFYLSKSFYLVFSLPLTPSSQLLFSPQIPFSPPHCSPPLYLFPLCVSSFLSHHDFLLMGLHWARMSRRHPKSLCAVPARAGEEGSTFTPCGL